jgi:hypothetical protein
MSCLPAIVSCLPVSPPACVSYLLACFSTCLCVLLACLFLYLPVCPTCLPISLPACVSHLLACFSTCLCVLLACLFLYLPVCPACLFLRLPVCPACLCHYREIYVPKNFCSNLLHETFITIFAGNNRRRCVKNKEQIKEFCILRRYEYALFADFGCKRYSLL